MGTIYLKAGLDEITPETLDQFNIEDLEYNEVQKLMNTNAGFRPALLKGTLTRHQQYYIHDIEPLTLQEAEQIVSNPLNKRLWEGLATNFEYSTEFLLENGNALSDHYVEGQRNITPEFVEKFQRKLQMSRVFERREEIGDTDLFLAIPGMLRYYIEVKLRWTSTEQELIHMINMMEGTQEQKAQAEALVKDWFNKPITRDLLRATYDADENSRYSSNDVVSYWNSNSRKRDEGYSNWSEYVEECKTGRDALVSTWFNDYLRYPIFQIFDIDG